jgi:hypothetical protein
VLASGSAALVVAGCGTSATGSVVTSTTRSASMAHVAHRPPRRRPAPPAPSYPQVVHAALGSSPTAFVPAVRWRGQTAVWIARSSSGVALLSFDQRLVTLRLHSGTVDAGGSGWRFGPAVTGAELGRLIAAFNGGFKFSTGAGGFESFGRVGAPLVNGRGSIVTYVNGQSDIGAWHVGMPALGTPVASVRQNLTLLINGGTVAPNVGCVSCWGATLGGVTNPARSALGVTADGHLVWAGGEHLTPAGLADALLGAHVVRAVELDINPEWVAGYLYAHRGGEGPLAPVPLVPGQPGVPGFFLSAYSRDFFTIESR